VSVVQCDECGQQVSNRAKTCPSCGARVSRPRRPSRAGPGLWMLGAAVACCAFLVVQHVHARRLQEKRKVEYQKFAGALEQITRELESSRKDPTAGWWALTQMAVALGVFEKVSKTGNPAEVTIGPMWGALSHDQQERCVAAVWAYYQGIDVEVDLIRLVDSVGLDIGTYSAQNGGLNLG